MIVGYMLVEVETVEKTTLITLGIVPSSSLAPSASPCSAGQNLSNIVQVPFNRIGRKRVPADQQTCSRMRASGSHKSHRLNQQMTPLGT